MSSTARAGTLRRYGPDVGEPPPLVDPRRWGSVVGLAGGLLFVAAYSSALGSALSTVAQVVAGALALAALFGTTCVPWRWDHWSVRARSPSGSTSAVLSASSASSPSARAG